MDVLTIWLAASRPDLWYYYAIMATVGAVLGAYLTYSLAGRAEKKLLSTSSREKR